MNGSWPSGSSLLLSLLPVELYNQKVKQRISRDFHLLAALLMKTFPEVFRQPCISARSYSSFAISWWGLKGGGGNENHSFLPEKKIQNLSLSFFFPLNNLQSTGEMQIKYFHLKGTGNMRGVSLWENILICNTTVWPRPVWHRLGSPVALHSRSIIYPYCFSDPKCDCAEAQHLLCIHQNCNCVARASDNNVVMYLAWPVIALSDQMRVWTTACLLPVTSPTWHAPSLMGGWHLLTSDNLGSFPYFFFSIAFSCLKRVPRNFFHSCFVPDFFQPPPPQYFSLVGANI